MIFPEFKALLQRLYHHPNNDDRPLEGFLYTSQFSGGKRGNDQSFKKVEDISAFT